MKYVVCYSGGHSSAMAAVETVRRHGAENTILLNHDISPEVEHADIKRFKAEVAEYLGLSITYANMPGWETLTPLKIAVQQGVFGVKPGTTFCTHNLKTQPFYKWLKDNYPATADKPNRDIMIVYGFDRTEELRVIRRAGVLGAMGYYTDFPLVCADHSIQNIEEIGIKRPITYENQKHANCIGCLKAGRQHWYFVYCLYPAIFQEAMAAEELTGQSIIKGAFLEELLPKFQQMRDRGITPQDTEQPQKFWARVKQELADDAALPCECSI